MDAFAKNKQAYFLIIFEAKRIVKNSENINIAEYARLRTLLSFLLKIPPTAIEHMLSDFTPEALMLDLDTLLEAYYDDFIFDTGTNGVAS